ncbi:MAG: helix-turn-helix domain-containing protein [Solidesulfovibrio sp.]|uniref:helix-turn-helix domain-containing protein n=1 Tax=Solidesulfovibrio sp. TaxID=2910990 RepID=UPI002B20772C|nr:helix-turn-helix domain-containing protein [Solidesulfovibrio sp.]MEA4856116.1 helix-turn-helix domain-containing protein [Solidesulfovibrio sp.]
MLTTIQAAEILGIRSETVRQQIQAGRLSAVKHGRDWFIDPDELDRYRRERQQNGRSTRWKEAKAKQTTE